MSLSSLDTTPGNGGFRHIMVFRLMFSFNLADAFMQSDLQLIRLSRGQSLLDVGLRGLAQGPNSCADIVATLGIEPLILWGHVI